MKDANIYCKDLSEFKQLMKFIESSDNNVSWHTWYSVGKPTELDFLEGFFPIVIHIKNNTITWEQYASSEYATINLCEKDAELVLVYDFIFMNDPVNHPVHYTSGKVECIDAMKEVFGAEVVKGFCLGNTFKYLWRRKDKGAEKQDIEKALWYFDRYKKEVEE